VLAGENRDVPVKALYVQQDTALWLKLENLATDLFG